MPSVHHFPNGVAKIKYLTAWELGTILQVLDCSISLTWVLKWLIVFSIYHHFLLESETKATWIQSWYLPYENLCAYFYWAGSGFTHWILLRCCSNTLKVLVCTLRYVAGGRNYWFKLNKTQELRTEEDFSDNNRISFSWLKMHSITHLIESIEGKGVTVNTSTDGDEAIHPQMRKHWQRSNYQPDTAEDQVSRFDTLVNCLLVLTHL